MLERFACGRSASNTYLYAPEGRDAVLVDAGPGVAPRVVSAIEDAGVELVAILLTHGHPDHVWSVRALARRYDVPVHLHPADVGWLDDPATGGHIPVLTMAGRAVGRVRALRPPGLQDAAAVGLGGRTIRPLHTPGHTRGSVSWTDDEVCFTGDTLFAKNLGHTGYPGGRRWELVRSVTDELLPLPDRVKVLPGHGPATTIGDARRIIRAALGR